MLLTLPSLLPNTEEEKGGIWFLRPGEKKWTINVYYQNLDSKQGLSQSLFSAKRVFLTFS